MDYDDKEATDKCITEDNNIATTSKEEHKREVVEVLLARVTKK